jgi:small subunit ribosomal protein S17
MPRKQKTGVVVSDKMQKSVVVEVTRTKKHPLYKKYVRVRKRYMAHDEDGVAHIGDFVRIQESRPLSASKRWALVEVLRTAHGNVTVGHVATAAHHDVDPDLVAAANLRSEAEAGTEHSGSAVASEPVYEVPAAEPAAEGEPTEGSEE